MINGKQGEIILVSKYLIWIKVPATMPKDAMAQMSGILQQAFKDSEFGFFIVPDKFDVLSRVEVKEWLEQTLRELNIDALEERDMR